jgi:hypothetical protein
VARYLSDEWLAAADQAASTSREERADPAGELVVQHLVMGGPEGPRSFHVALSARGVRITPGEAGDAAITFTQDYDTAAAIARGELSAQEAFMAGRLRVGGDLRALVDHHRSLQEIDDVLGSVRAQTSY